MLLIPAIAAAAGAAIGAYITGRYREKGRLDAIKEALPEVLDQAFQRAYEAEKGKRLATHEDVENVRREVKLVTAETETIKNRISAGEWDRQWRMDRKREVYARLLELTTEMQGAWVKVSSAVTNPRVAERQKTLMDESLLELQQLAPELRKAQAMAMIFANRAANDALAEHMQQPEVGGDDIALRAQSAILILENLRTRLIQAARADLEVG